MKAKTIKMRDTAKNYWGNLSKRQKGTFIGSGIFIIIILAVLSFLAFNTNYVPLYNDLSVEEVSQIKTELEARGIPYEIKDGGTTINVPEQQADSLIVDLAGEGIPSSGHIDYSFFSENASWGITDNEFNIMKLDAMQTELANLIKGIEGIHEADVMINLPQDSVFVSETDEEATASIVIHTQPGYEFKGNQIESLYHLVSKAVPHLPEENIVIRNQYLEYFDNGSYATPGSHDDYTYQQMVKKDIERDIQRRLQQMLGSMVGMDNVIVSVTTDIDFTQENRVEDLVDPVDLDNMEGLPVSVETIHETYSGNPEVGGIAGAGDDDIAGYGGADEDDGGEYELVKETINNEFNRIRKEIVESPYKVRDLGVQVAIDSVVSDDGTDVQYLTQQDMASVEDGISSILHSMISTSIDKDYGDINPEEKVSIVFQEFSGKQATPQVTAPVIPLWMYITGSILLLIIIILVILLVRNRKQDEDLLVEEMETPEETFDIPDIAEAQETESEVRKKQLEKMARENPEEFTKLLRSWIADD
ncbi:MAG TPA: flagellar basal-body MS-ring/collar protein FliF [Virgibacillus sp.]|nr:flagellar basal-body MS-ring/collar protein FliF [Virgibacillus sp.]